MEEDRLLKYFEINFSARIDPEDNLFEIDVLDSFNIVKLIQFLEESFDVIIDPENITQENFTCVRNIVRLLKTKMSA
jgi:acyl carrier protein